MKSAAPTLTLTVFVRAILPAKASAVNETADYRFFPPRFFVEQAIFALHIRAREGATFGTCALRAFVGGRAQDFSGLAFGRNTTVKSCYIQHNFPSILSVDC